MTRRFIALAVVAAVLSVPFLAGCHNHDRDEKTTKMKVDTEGSHKEMSIKHD
jgi:outer membrane murein-binding lipoprotein Lpp